MGWQEWDLRQALDDRRHQATTRAASERQKPLRSFGRQARFASSTAPGSQGFRAVRSAGDRGQPIAEAPPTTSRISWVMAAWRALL
jgi:hypothetical protein